MKTLDSRGNILQNATRVSIEKWGFLVKFNLYIVDYVINRYLNPFYKHFFEQRDIEIDEDNYALSELLQWIWRSAIRNGEEINLYIPSQRMRELLEGFLTT